MFKKIKENEGVQKFKELWQNKKTHDIMVLALWFVFIFIVILFARSTTSNSTYIPEEPNKEELSNILNYEFTYKKNDKEIQGQYYDNAIIFYKDNKRYYYKDKIYLIDETPTLTQNQDLDILRINIKMINNLINDITPTEIMDTKQYVVPLDRFISLYELDTDIDLSKIALYNVPITIFYNDNEINKITLDLSNYYSLKTNTNVTYPLTIYLYNINNVSDFRKSYDKLLEVNP